MILISRNTGTSYVDLLGVSYYEIDRIFDALKWAIEGENEARREAEREARARAERDGR